MTKALTLAMTLFLGVAAVHAAADWPQWQGPDRTRISKETGLLKEWLSGEYNDLILTCLEFATGKMMWRDRSVGKGSVTSADGHLYLQSPA